MLSRARGRLWVALREGDRLVSLTVEDPAAGPLPGRIARGRITRVMAGMQAAFVELGDDATGLLPASALVDPRAPRRGPIDELLQPGRELLVQVRRAARDGKVAELTARIELVGRYLIFHPTGTRRAISRRVRDPEVRDRLAAALARIDRPDGGWIARSAAASAPAEAVLDEAERLRSRWRKIAERADAPGAPRVLWHEPDLVACAVRDAPCADEVVEIVVDDVDLRSAVLERLPDTAPDLVGRVRLVQPAGRLYDEEISSAVAEILEERVPLPSGGSITIEQTAAVVSIDVDSGSEGGRAAPDALERANRDAAREIPRQLRLRNLGGIVVVDWIPLPDGEAMARVLEVFSAEIARDPARTRVAGPSGVGLFEFTRERVGRAAAAVLETDCPACSGRGRSRQRLA